MGSDESHFNVWLVVRGKVARQCPQITTFEEKESRSGIEPRSFRLPAYRLTVRPNRLSTLDAPFSTLRHFSDRSDLKQRSRSRVLWTASDTVAHLNAQSWYFSPPPNPRRIYRDGTVSGSRWRDAGFPRPQLLQLRPGKASITPAAPRYCPIS